MPEFDDTINQYRHEQQLRQAAEQERANNTKELDQALNLLEETPPFKRLEYIDQKRA
jgi:hypothetical protein